MIYSTQIECDVIYIKKSEMVIKLDPYHLMDPSMSSKSIEDPAIYGVMLATVLPYFFYDCPPG